MGNLKQSKCTNADMASAIRSLVASGRFSYVTARILANRGSSSALSCRPLSITSVSRGGGVEEIVTYRGPDPETSTQPELVARGASKSSNMLATYVMATAWWWITWHLLTEPGHVFGEFNTPDPRDWTDEELGIPPDDVDVE